MAPTEGGYWGRVTSTIDWCEENYVVSRYVAEFWNTISNLIMILAPLFTSCLAVRQKLEKPVIFSYVSIVVVGCGSWLFHMTLQYSMQVGYIIIYLFSCHQLTTNRTVPAIGPTVTMTELAAVPIVFQLMDELPMIWGSAFLLYGILTLEGERNKNYYGLMLTLLVYCLAVTVMYLVNNNPVFHEAAYGVMVAAMVFGALRSLLKYQNKVGTILYGASFLTYMSGFLLWNIDNIYCQHLRSLRRDKLHSAATPLFECHAWWHILAGMGTYFCLLFVSYMRYTILNMSPEVKFLFGVWPYVSVPSAAHRLKLN